MEIIQVEDIGQCRSGPDNDIDLQAVYGGRFSGRKEKDLKINPVYSDVNNVNQFSDINGNMSPVHVVTYETFPRSRKDKIPSENGKIQNGDAIQTLRINLTENDNNNILDKEKHDNSKGFIDKDRNNKNHVGETKNQKLCKGNGNLNHLNELSCKSSKKASSELVNGHDNQQTDTKIHATADTDSIHSTTDQEVQTKAYFKDYGLLGYSNGSFVLDETHIIIETKPTEVENTKKQSINEIHTNCSDVINHEETKCVHLINSKVNCENSNCVSKEQPTVTPSQQNSQTETIIISDLPESTYQEISDLCDLNTPISEGLCSPRDLSVNTSEDLPNPCESPQICPTEIVTEVLVHNSAVNETPIMHYREKYSENDNMCHSFDTDKIQTEVLSQTGDSDWPDIDVLARKPDDGILYQSTDEIAQNDGNKVDSPGHVRSISDVILQDKDRNKSSVNNQGDPCSSQNSDGSSLYKKNEKKSNSCSKSCVMSEVGSSTRTLKSILSNGSSHNLSCPLENEHRRQNSDLEIHELKCVKFSEDTVFNENKSNKYKKEKFGQINLRELYRGKIMSDNAVAKMNPLYQPDDNLEEDGVETDNEKLTYQLTLKNALRLSKEQRGSLNGPSYLEQYLILKAHGIKKDNIDIEKLPETMEKPVYDRLIQRTLAKERRKFCVKWSMVIITVAIITAVATTLGVYFKNNF